MPDLPETLITGREEIWLRFIFQSWTYDPEVLTPEEIAVYVRSYRQHGALRGAFEDYRAAKTDVAQDQYDQHIKIACPTLVLWGTEFEAGGKMWDFEAIWREMATNVRFAPVEQCGHLPQEERPDQVNPALLDFLAGWEG